MLSDTKIKFKKIGQSQLRIHQKHHAVKTFIIPSWEYFVRTNGLGLHHASLLGKALRTAIAKYTGLPFSTTSAFFHCQTNDGGLGFPEPGDWASCTQIMHVLGLINSPDEIIVQTIVTEPSQLYNNGTTWISLLRPTNFHSSKVLTLMETRKA